MNPLTNFEFGLGLIIYYYAIILDTTNLCQSIIGNHSNQYLVRFSDFPLTLTRSVCCKISWYQTHGLFMEMNDNCYEPRIRQGHRGKEMLTYLGLKVLALGLGSRVGVRVQGWG